MAVRILRCTQDATAGWRRRAAGPRPAVAFSLLEVVIAIGLFAAAVAVMLALLPALTRQAAGSADTLNAVQLPDAIRAELQRVAAAGGFDALAGRTRPMAAPLPDTLVLVAPRDATSVQSLDYQPPAASAQIARDEQFFQIEAWSFGSGPLAFDPAGAVLALRVRVSWPYHTPGSAPATPLADREQLAFDLVLNR